MLGGKRGFGDGEIGFGLRDRELIWHRIDLEQKISLGHPGVLRNRNADDPTADRSGDVYDIGINRCGVG